jgi:hypothetical protein
VLANTRRAAPARGGRCRALLLGEVIGPHEDANTSAHADVLSARADAIARRLRDHKAGADGHGTYMISPRVPFSTCQGCSHDD